MPISDRLELKDCLLIPLALVAIAIGAIKLMGRVESPILKALAAITSGEFSLIIVTLALTTASVLYVLERRREGGGFTFPGRKKFGIAILEVEEVPRNYLIKDKLGDERWTQVFETLIRSLSLREQPFCLHIHFEDRRGRIRILLGKVPQDTEDHLVSLVQSQLAGFTLTKGQKVPLPSLPSIAARQIRGIYQHARGDVESASDALHALTHFHRTGNIEIKLKPILKGDKTELYIPRELWRATAGYEAVKFNLTFPNGEKTTMYKPSCHGKYQDVPSLCNDIAKRLRSSRFGSIETRLEELTKEQFIQETPKRRDVDYEFKEKDFYIKIGGKRIKAHDVSYSFMRSSPTTTSELRIDFNILDKKQGTKNAFRVSYDGRNPPKNQVIIGSHPPECHFSYNKKFYCIEVSYKSDTGRKTGDHRIDHVKVIDLRSYPREVIIDLDNQTGIISEKILTMTYGSTTDKGAAGNIIAGAVQRKSIMLM